MSLQAGQVVDGKYRIVRLIGEGGMGAVYEGENTLIKRRVAIKVLHAGVANSVEMVQRFEREAQVAGTVGNDHILEILDLGSLPSGERYMVMEFLDGQTLTDRIKSRGRLSPREAFTLLKQALAGLAAAHSAGIVHRDLKPENIFILRQKAGHRDFVKIIDFGISKFSGQGPASRMTRTGALMGTPHYMAPEQATGSSEIDARTDIYALGIILYEALTGRVPFEAESFNKLLFEIALAKITPASQFAPDLDPSIDSLIFKATARDPAHRFQSCEEFAAALEAWERTGAAVALPPEQSLEAIVAASVPRAATGSLPVSRSSSGPPAQSAPVPSGGGAAYSAPPATQPASGAAQYSVRDSATGASYASLPTERAGAFAAPPAEGPRPTHSSWSNSRFDAGQKKSATPVVAATIFGMLLLASGAGAGFWFFSRSPAPASPSPGVPSAPAPAVPPAPPPADSPPAEAASAVAKATPEVAVAPAPSGAASVASPTSSSSSTKKPPPRVTRPAPKDSPAVQPGGGTKPRDQFNFGY